MTDNNKSARETLKDIFTTVLSGREGREGEEGKRIDFSTAKDILAGTLSWAGKSKDEFIQMLCRETGQALAQGLQGPILEILKENKINLTLTLEPKTAEKRKKKKPAAEDESSAEE